MAEPAMPLESVDDVVSKAVTVDSAALGGCEVIERAGRRTDKVERGDEGDPAALADAALHSTIMTDRQIVADQLPLQQADQDDTADNTVSNATAVAPFALGEAGHAEEFGELRDDIEMGDEFDAIVFTSDAVADGLSPIMAPMALGTAVYSDYDYFFDDEAVDLDQSEVLDAETPFDAGAITQSLADLDWDWKNGRVTAPMDKATHIIFPGGSDEVVVDSRPLGLVPQNEIDAIVTKLKGHMHLFEANGAQDSPHPEAVGPGYKDFCVLYRVKVPFGSEGAAIHYVLNTPRPLELETSCDALRSEILAVFRLSALPGWVYVAMVEDEDDTYDELGTLIDGCRVVVRADTAITRWDGAAVVLSMGTGTPTFYRILGEEFKQAFMCLSHPTTFYDTRDLFSVGEWVCIGRPGTYWGDVGLVRSLTDSEEDDHITVLLVPRTTDPVNQSVFEAAFVRPALRKTLWFHTSDDPEILLENGEETWYLGRERMTKDGMVLRMFSPWELRKDMTDGTDLYLLPEQETHFRHSLPPEYWLHMPPVRDPRPHFIRGERVQVAGHKGILAGWDRSFGPGHEAFPRRDSTLSAEMERIYSETCKGHVACHHSFITKLHKEGDTVFAFGLNENVLVLECDYLKQEVKIQLRATAARRYKRESLVRVVHPNSLRSQLIRGILDSNGVVYKPLIEPFLKQLRWSDTLTYLWLRRAVYVIGNPKVKGHVMEVRDVTRVSDSVARAAPLSSGVIVTVYDENVVDGKQTWLVDYDMVRDYVLGIPLAYVPWVHANGPPSPKAFGLNPDYLINRPAAIYPSLPLSHPNRLFNANTNAVIYPQRRHTPPPPHLIWHETTFIEENWAVLADVLIRYYKRNTNLVRVARIRTKDNGQGFWMQARACRKDTPEASWKWEEVKYTELTPLTACHQNKDYPWIIISGGQDVGRYCKAISCPKIAEDAKTTDLRFLVALARVEVRNGERVTIMDDPMQSRQIRQGDLAVVFRTLAERKKEPSAYEGVRATARKRKHTSVDNEMQVDGDAEAPTTKKPRIAESPTDNEKVMADAAEPNVETVVDGGAEDNESVVVEPSLASVMDGEVEDDESLAVEPNLVSVMDAEAEDNEMEEHHQSQVNTEDVVAGSQ